MLEDHPRSTAPRAAPLRLRLRRFYPAEGAGCGLLPPTSPRRPNERLRISGGADVSSQTSVFTETMNVPALMKCHSGSPRLLAAGVNLALRIRLKMYLEASFGSVVPASTSSILATAASRSSPKPLCWL